MTPARILIVEDDRIVARDIAEQLTRIGHTVVGETARGEEALPLTLATKPELVLMDIRLEGKLDGIDAAEQIRAHSHVPVIFLTAYTDDRTVRRASKAEPFGYLIKPFEDSQLRTAIEMALYKHAADQRLRASERRYAVTLSSIGDGVIATDATGAVTFLNPKAEALTGWTQTEAVGQPLKSVLQAVDEDTGAPMEDAAARALHPRTIAEPSRRTLLVSRDGRQVAVDDAAAPIFDDRGELAGVVVVLRDVTERRLAEQAEVLRRSNARLELALRGSDIGIWDFEMVDGDPFHARVNTVNFWGPHSKGQGHTPSFSEIVDRWHPADRERTLEAMRVYFAGEIDRYQVECRTRMLDGEYRTRLARGVAVRDEAGTPTRFIGTLVDITDRVTMERALRDSEERYRNTFEQAPAGMVHTDLGTHAVLRVNQTYCDLTGWSRDELLGTGGMDVLHPEDREVYRSQLAALARGEATTPYATQLRICRKDGSVTWIRITVSLGRDSTSARPHAIGMIEDVSERKRLESDLKAAKEAAEASNRAKDEFLANVSHEIRTPMNAILGMTELVLDTPLGEAQRQSLRTVKSAAASLLAIINDLLDFSKIEAGKIELDPVEFQLRALLGDTMRALAVRAHRKGLELLCNIAPDAPDTLVGDAGRLRQVLINLVGNAIKFTARGEVQVDVTCLERTSTEAELRFAVRDTGIGIPVEKQASIFRAFEQEDMSTTRRYGGTGLGLTIAARFVEMMGGAITVESVARHGSTFAFNARFRWREQAVASGLVPNPSLVGPLRVLVVDDNAANRDILEQWLTGWRMESTGASDGMTAMDALWHGVASRHPYALVLLDARMPDTDGLTLAAKIRERAELAATRIILLTSGDRPGDIERFRELRIDAHLLKPVPQDELLDTIHEVMTRTTEAVGSPPVTMVRTAAEAPPPTTLPLRILVAEDNTFNSQLLQQLLSSRGHAVRVANDGREALEYARGGGFDVLLLDLHMPELDGFQVIAALRLHEKTAGGHLKTIALTARSRIEDRARCFDAGMDDFLAKPIHAAALWAAIERMTAAPGASEEPLLSADVLLATCGGQASILDAIRLGLRARLAGDLGSLERLHDEGDAVGLREAAHSLYGMLAAFSTVAGRLASSIEDAAVRGDLRAAREGIAALRAIAPALLRAVDAASIAFLEADVAHRSG